MTRKETLLARKREYTLKADIERLTAAIAKQKVDNERNAKTAAYYATEEGAAHKAQLENEKRHRNAYRMVSRLETPSESPNWTTPTTTPMWAGRVSWNSSTAWIRSTDRGEVLLSFPERTTSSS